MPPKKKKHLLPLHKSNCNFMNNAIAVVNAYGEIKPCCVFAGSNLTTKTVFDVDTLDDMLTSSTWNNYKNNLKHSRKKYDACNACWQKETHGIASKRQFAYNHNSKLDKITPGKIQYLELALDYTCNMMCRMCRPACSSKWQAAKFVKQEVSKLDRNHFTSFDLEPNTYKNKLKQVLENTDLSNLRTLQLVGGEPFYSKNFAFLMEKIAEECDLSKLTLQVTTNGSIVPTDYFALFEKLKYIKIMYSIDAIGDLANCIRWGVDFGIIESNIKKWHKLQAKEIRFVNTATLNIQNCNKINELVLWCNKNKINFASDILKYPQYLQLAQLPLKVRNKFALQKDLFLEEYAYQNATNILMTTALVSNKLKEFLESCEILDKHQGIQFKKVNPEIYNLAKKYAVY